MPIQLITLEVSYDPLDDDGDERTEPVHWPWENMADHYSECEGEWTETNYVKVFAPSPLKMTPNDAVIIREWHSDHCEVNCGNPYCPAAEADDDEDEDDED